MLIAFNIKYFMWIVKEKIQFITKIIKILGGRLLVNQQAKMWKHSEECSI